MQTLFLHPYQRHVHSGQEQIGSISHEDDEDVGTQGLPFGNAEMATCELGVSKVAMGACWGAQPLSRKSTSQSGQLQPPLISNDPARSE